MSQTILVLATRNPGKLRELRDLLSGWPLDLRSLDDVGFKAVLEEPGPGYTESALAKAAAVCLATDLPALADDSGIEVDALHGWPGPHSARWMGDAATDDDRMYGLLAEVERKTPDDRRARYVCVAALARRGARDRPRRVSRHHRVSAPREQWLRLRNQERKMLPPAYQPLR